MKIKVSGGTQTYVVSDSEYGQYMGSPGSCRKSYSQSPTPTPTAAAAAAAAATTTIVNNGGQTGQQRDGVFGSRSLPKGASSLNYGLMIDRIQQKRQQRQFNPKVHDGSLSDSNYVAYEAAARASSPYSWLQPASTYAANIAHHSTADPYQQQQVRPLEEVSTMSSDILASNESLNSVSSSIQQARANSLTKARLILHQQQHQRASMTNNGAKISTRSNVSEKSYSSLSTAARTDQETEYYGIPFGIRNRSSATGSNINNNSSHLTSPNKAESTYLSLAPIGSEESQTDAEIFKLRRELADEHSKVLNLTSQLATNCHVVSAFEQSLANMTARLQQLTATSEKKDLELNELRRNIEIFRQSGVDAGLITAGHTDQYGELVSDSGDEGGLSSLSSKSKKGTPKRSGWLRNSFSKAFTKPGNSNKKKNSLGGGSVSESEGDSCHGTPKHQPRHQQQQHPVYNGRSASALSGQINNVPMSPIKASRSTDTIDDSSNPVPPEVVNELQRQLMEKENLLTETRLEALSSAHQLESLRDTVTKMRNELMSVKYENEKLHTMVTMTSHKSLSSSQTSLNKIGNDNHPNDNGNDAERRHSSTLSETSILSGPSSLDLSATTDPTNREGGKLVPVSVLTTDKAYTRIGTISVSGRTNWDLIDSLVHRLFKEYVMRVDPTSNLGLSADSIGHYQVGEIRRTNMSRKPELLPYGYIVGDTTDIMISLRRSDPTSESVHVRYCVYFPIDNLMCVQCIYGYLLLLQVDALAFETLTPKSIIQRYVSLLLEHKRVIFSGPSGAGKTFMANKLANFLVSKSKKSIATFAVQRNNVPELKDFLQRIASNGSDQESNVIILDNLQHAGRLDEVLSDCILPTSSYIIGTLNQSGQGVQTPTNLQLQHNFRFVQHSTHTEPLRGLVGRCLRQRLLSIETKTRMQDGEMSAAVDWVARIHQHLNRVLESHASGDATLAPALFLDCPIGTDGGPEAQGEQVRRWFLQLWNGELHIKITESIKEGIQMYGHRAHWEDPVQFLIDSWPWANSVPIELKRIHPIDVGYDARKFPDVQVAANKLVVGSSSGDRPSSTGTSISSGSGTNTTTDSDPLFNMLLHLQEAANNGSK
jgi:neuron navigator 2